MKLFRITSKKVCLACHWECTQGMKSPLSSGGKRTCFQSQIGNGEKNTLSMPTYSVGVHVKQRWQQTHWPRLGFATEDEEIFLHGIRQDVSSAEWLVTVCRCHWRLRETGKLPLSCPFMPGFKEQTSCVIEVELFLFYVPFSVHASQAGSSRSGSACSSSSELRWFEHCGSSWGWCSAGADPHSHTGQLWMPLPRTLASLAGWTGAELFLPAFVLCYIP